MFSDMSDFEVTLRDVGFQMCQFPGFIVRCRFSEVSVFWVSLRDDASEKTLHHSIKPTCLKTSGNVQNVK
jgi:hypothetical protein